MKNKKSVSKRRKQKMSKTHKKTKNTTKKIGGSANNNNNESNNKFENGELNSLYKRMGELQSELQDIQGKIFAIETNQYPDSNKKFDVIEKRKLEILDKIAVLNEQINKKETAWEKHADKMLSRIASRGISNAIRRSKPNHVSVTGRTTLPLLLIGVVGIAFAAVKTK